MTTLLFDGNCGFCTRSRNLLRRLDRRGRIDTVPYQAPGVVERFGIDERRLAASVWVVHDGTAYAGAEAINAALSVALGTRLPSRIYRLPGIRTAQDATYHWVAANRHRLPGATPWCQANPGACR